MTRSTQRFILALGVLTLGAVFAAALIFVPIPPGNEPVLTVALGLVLGWGASVVGYFFGTSESSSHKNDLMQSMADRDTYHSAELPTPAFGKVET